MTVARLGRLLGLVVWVGQPAALAAPAPERGPGADAVEWAPMAPLAVRSLLLDGVRTGDRIVAVGERGHVLVSTDGGASWTQQRVPTRSMLTGVAAAGRDVWAVGHDAIVLHSADAGSSWTEQFAAPDRDAPLLDVWFADARRGLAVGAYGLALATSDGGRRWHEVTIDEEERHLNAVVAAGDRKLYVPAEDGVVFRSRDGGGTWEAVTTPYQGSLFGGVALRTGAVLVFGLRGHVLRSTDDGATWTQADTGTDATLQGAAELSDGTVMVVGLSGTVLVSRDGGQHFEARNRPDRHALSAVLPVGGGRVVLFGEDGPVAMHGGALEITS